jgi:F0F1-type ATP synthase alpha subunit
MQRQRLVLNGAPVGNVRIIEAELFALIEREKAHIFKSMDETRAISDEVSAELKALVPEFKKQNAHLYTA